MNDKVYQKMLKRFGESFRNYREKWEMAGRGEIELDFPLHINFELNWGCNLRCPCCLCSMSPKSWPYAVDPKTSIQYDKFCEIIDECVVYYLPSIELNGVNEPLLYKEIVKCLEYASKKDIMHISMHTNALLLTSDMSKRIVDSGITNISFSLDAATDLTYNKIRKGSDYKKVLENIDNFLKIKGKKEFPLTRVSLTRNKINCDEIEMFNNLWKDKVDEVSTSLFYNPFVGSPDFDKIEKEYRIESRPPESCYQPFQRLFVFNNGNVAPCCSMSGGNLVVGNVYNNSIRDIWNGEKIRRIREMVIMGDKLPNACKNCNTSHAGK